jgi:30S ribosomal protein S31
LVDWRFANEVLAVSLADLFCNVGATIMGKGDKRTTKGKIYKGSYGNKRPHSVKTFVAAPVAAVKKPAVLATAAKKKSA